MLRTTRGNTISNEQNATPMQGLGEFKPLVSDYARRPITEGFDWPAITRNLKSTRVPAVRFPLYLVVFRSQLLEGADVERLAERDLGAHEAALRSPALLHYFTGEADDQGYNLSFCIWRGQIAAREASATPEHVAAMSVADEMYASFSLERHAIHDDDEIVRL
ncbi:MAG: hypothetical protein JWN38_785 [Candidatus Saccharibacteria bacterium]|nr:hypothetical protein [Candidatus Saccharibacteria bacterium]